MNSLPYFYQYGVGGIVLLAGLLVAWKLGWVGPQRGAPRRNLILLVGGYFALAALQGYLQFVAPLYPHKTLPYDGPPAVFDTFGTGLDYAVIVGYFLAILGLGSWFGRYNKSTSDFFFGGQKFSWWFITMSLVATTIGSYSFVKYSRIAYSYGIASSQTYLNDWFWLPLFLFVWLPIIYFSKISSIPEYFERRFGKKVRLAVTGLLLVYLIGYIGVNLFTMGVVLQQLLGWPILLSAAGVATISAVYVTYGGQTSVIVTDLLQGVMLLATGGIILTLGIGAVGGFSEFWSFLPPGHRQAFPNFNDDPSYSAVGVFWQDAIANSAVFYFLNQGIIMRFLSVKSVQEGKKAALATVLILMPIAALVVASGGWVGRAMESAAIMPPGVDPDRVFFWVANFLCQPGVFGLVLAALTAALMSTVDTLVTAVAAIVVNDIWRPYVRPGRKDSYYLSIARRSSMGVMFIGVALVPLFMQFDSIYSAHGAFTAAVTPPLVVAVLYAILWPRFTPAAALATVVGGFGLVVFSVFVPEVVAPFSHGIPNIGADGTVLEGAKAYKFTRALYGLVVSAVLGFVVTLFTKPRSEAETKGLVWSSVKDAVRAYKGGDSNPWTPAKRLIARVNATGTNEIDDASGRPLVRMTQPALDALEAVAGDFVLLSDKRWWYGGLRSAHAQIAEGVVSGEGAVIELGEDLDALVGRTGGVTIIEKLL